MARCLPRYADCSGWAYELVHARTDDSRALRLVVISNQLLRESLKKPLEAWVLIGQWWEYTTTMLPHGFGLPGREGEAGAEQSGEAASGWATSKYPIIVCASRSEGQSVRLARKEIAVLAYAAGASRWSIKCQRR